MRYIFLSVLNMSLTASGIIGVVLLARLALRKAPKVFSYALWAVVLFRLLCPITIESGLSLISSVQPIPPETIGSPRLYIDSGISAIDEAVNDYLGDHYFEGVALAPANAKADFFDWAAVVWLAGAALLLVYSLISLLRLFHRLVGWVPLAGEEHVRLADHIPSPFVLGIFRPKIYVPSGLAEEELDYILLHERTHIRRGDHIFRALAWLALAVHWFNPLVWLAFHLAGRDMEMSCDEAVLRKMGRDVRADYSTSLLRLSQGGKLPAGPLAFGGGDPASRIKNVLSYKKPAVWVMVLALAGVLCAGAALATDQKQLYIDPDSVVSVIPFRGLSYTLTSYHTGVYTPDDRWKDMRAQLDSRALPQEDGAELVRLINAYGKTICAQGEFQLNGVEHHFYRIDCKDGGFYLVDYWYWNSFNLNPFIPLGEDPYTTLVTHFDPTGAAGTTWQMEYYFDRAFRDWHFRMVQNGAWKASANESTLAPDGDGTNAAAEEDFYKREPKVQFPKSSLRLTPTYSLDATGTSVVIGGLNCDAAVWRTSGAMVGTHLAGFIPNEPPLGCLTIQNPRFLGKMFKRATGSITVFYYPGAESFQLFNAFEGYTWGSRTLKQHNFLVDLITGVGTHKEFSGFPSRTVPIDDDDILQMGRALAQLVQEAAGFYSDARSAD